MMKINELLEEIRDILNTASGVPLTSRVIVEKEELLDIVREIEEALPDEIKQARWIQGEKDRILNEAKEEYATVVSQAQKQADHLVDENEILTRSKERAEQILVTTKSKVQRLKLNTYDYVDKVLYGFQEKMDELNGLYQQTFQELGDKFGQIDAELEQNRKEIKEMAFRSQEEQNEE